MDKTREDQISAAATLEAEAIRQPRCCRFLPWLDWIGSYTRQSFSADLFAGLIVAILLIPQAMAYATLAGLPPESGLYAAMLPLLVYPIFGSSRYLSVAPVALDSLLVANAIQQVAPTADLATRMHLGLTLAAFVGAIQITLGLARLGVLANFLSHPVLTGFTTAAAILIAASQVKHLLGINLPQAEHIHELILRIGQNLPAVNPWALFIGGVSLILLFATERFGRRMLQRHPEKIFFQILSRSGALIAVILCSILAWSLALEEREELSVVGQIPPGLPRPGVPAWDFDLFKSLLPHELAISFVSFLESISVGKALAARRRETIDASQELIAVGSANLSAAFFRGYPVAGGLSRTMVNFTAGARTGVASMTTAVLMMLFILFLTPALAHLPQATLAAIILFSVIRLVDLKKVAEIWKYERADGAAMAVTFLLVLTIGIEKGILAGMLLSLLTFLWRTSKPHIAVVGRVPNTEHYRNVLRHHVETLPGVLTIRIDESLYFPNTKYIEDAILRYVAENRTVRSVVLVFSAVNYIDSTAVETLSSLVTRLKETGINTALAEVKGPVMDRLKRSRLLDILGAHRVFLSTHQAVSALKIERDST